MYPFTGRLCVQDDSITRQTTPANSDRSCHGAGSDGK